LSGRADFSTGLRPAEQPPVAFVLFVPVYRDGAPTGTVAQRRAAFLGWASCPFRASDFLNGTLRGPRQQLGVELFDQSADDANRIASFPDGFRAGGPDLRTSEVEVGGRRWLLRTSPLPGAQVRNSTYMPARVVLAAGLLLTVLLAGLVWLLARRARTVRLLDRQRAGLAVASAFKSDLIGMLSHDLRQPLASVVGHVELLREDWDQIEEADKRRFLDKVADAAGRVDRLVEDLLTMTKGDAGKLEPDLRPVQVAAAVAEALAHVTPSEPIEVSVDPSVWVQADPGHLQQILINLLSNAVKYGSPPITVAAALTGGHHEGATDQAVELEVRDHGPGVPAEFVPKLFGRFARAERDDGIKGTGLGLYIVRQLVAAGHGELRYQAQPPSGAAFVVRLPAAEAPPGSHPTPGERPRYRSMAPAPRR
jgi:signal transduction histidine kinase